MRRSAWASSQPHWLIAERHAGPLGSTHAVRRCRGEQGPHGWELGYLDIGDDFTSEMGFFQRTGVRQHTGGGHWTTAGLKGVRQSTSAPTAPT